jgi:hypothetical protein
MNFLKSRTLSALIIILLLGLVLYWFTTEDERFAMRVVNSIRDNDYENVGSIHLWFQIEEGWSTRYHFFVKRTWRGFRLIPMPYQWDS